MATLASADAAAAGGWRMRMKRTVAPVAPAGKLAPGPLYNGTQGSGWTVGTEPDPELPRTTAKPWCVPLFVPYMTIGGEVTIVFDAGAKGGLEKLVGRWEGGVLDVTEETWHDDIDENGLPVRVGGYCITLDYDAAMAASATGDARLYVDAIALDPTMEVRTEGPFVFSPRAPGVGANKVFDVEYSLEKTPTEVTDTRYRTPKACLDRAMATGKIRPLITCHETGNYRLDAVASDHKPAVTWATFAAAGGSTMTVGDHEPVMANSTMKYDGLRFFGLGVVVDTAAMNPALGAILRTQTGSNRMNHFAGCEIKCGSPNPAYGGSGSGMAALNEGMSARGNWITHQSNLRGNTYFTNVWAHDLPGYGLSFCALVLNCLTERISGSAHENVHGAIHGGWTAEIGGVLSGLRVPENAFQISSSLGSCQMEITGNLGSGSGMGSYRRFRLYESAVQVLEVILDKTAGAVTQVQDVVDAVNALTGWTATASLTLRAATFLTIAGETTANPVALRTVNSTPTQMVAWMDIHADVLVWHGAVFAPYYDAYENVAVRFHTATNYVGAAWVSFNSDAPVRDFGLRNISGLDNSAAYGVGVSGAYVSCDFAEHLVWLHSSQVGGSTNFTTSFEPDSYCLFSHLHMETLAWSTRVGGVYPDLDIVGLSVRTGALPLGSDATSVAQGGLAAASIFADLTPADPSFLPIGGALVLSDTTVAGRYLASGQQQGMPLAA